MNPRRRWSSKGRDWILHRRSQPASRQPSSPGTAPRRPGYAHVAPGAAAPAPREPGSPDTGFLAVSPDAASLQNRAFRETGSGAAQATKHADRKKILHHGSQAGNETSD